MEKVAGQIVAKKMPLTELPPSHVNIIASCGWDDAVRSDQIGDDLRVTCLDVLQEDELTMLAEGPPTFSIGLCLSGTGTVEIDGAVPYAFTPGKAMLFSSDRHTRGYNHINAGERLTLIDVRFEKQFLQKAGGHQLVRFSSSLLNEHCAPQAGAYMLGFSMAPNLIKCAREIMQCSMAPGLSRDLFLRGKSLEVLAYAIEHSRSMYDSTTRFRLWEKHKVEQARELLETQFEKPWTIQRLAREVGLNEKKLKAGFRQLIGQTVHTYRQEIRMEAAASMLESGTSVTETAYATGYSSISHFSKMFRMRTGSSPSAYARNST